MRQTESFELTTEPSLALLSFRYAPAWADTEVALDEVNQALLNRINDDGHIYLTKTRVDGRTVIRFVIGQTYTRLEHVESGWAHVVETAEGLRPR